jgi:hypothetical protein
MNWTAFSERGRKGWECNRSWKGVCVRAALCTDAKISRRWSLIPSLILDCISSTVTSHRSEFIHNCSKKRNARFSLTFFQNRGPRWISKPISAKPTEYPTFSWASHELLILTGYYQGILADHSVYLSSVLTYWASLFYCHLKSFKWPKERPLYWKTTDPL